MPSRNNIKRQSLRNFKNNLTEKILKHPLLFSFIVVFVLFIVVLSVFVQTYRTNDDPGMASIVAGTGKTAQPDEHVRYSNVLVGFFLKGLYTISPYFPWYASFHLLIQFIAMVFFLYAVISHRFSFSRLIFFLLFFFGVELCFISSLQFTITSIMAGQCGIILFLSALGNGTQRRSWILICSGIFMLVLSCLIRRKGFYLVGLLSIPVLLITFIEKIGKISDKKSLIMKYSVFILCTILLTFSAIQFNRWYYDKDPEWNDFYRINTLKGQFIDYSRVSYNADTKPIFDEVGWSYNDFIMLMAWFYADLDVFSPKKMEKVLSAFPPYITKRNLKLVFRNFLTILGDSYIYLLLFLFFTININFKNWHDLIKAGSTFLMVIFVAFYMILYLKLPDRVYFPMFSLFVTVSLFLSDRDMSFKPRFVNALRIVLFVIIVMTFPGSLSEQYKNGKFIALKNKYLKQELAAINPNKNQLFYTWGAIFPHQYVLPFDNIEYLSNFKLIGLSSILHTPFTKRRMEEFGITDLYTGLYEKDNVFLIANSELLPHYIEYIREHYGVYVQHTILYTSHTFGFSVYKIERVS
ncbi:MAG: hypothetical protein JXB48_08090 [Candidatus Latescibacteria bacterium]|nr:hypothetical protein [Candidatus Latescibacterota bacterium]